MSDASGITLAANVAIFVSGILIPVLLLGLVGAIANWTKGKQEASSSQAALWVSGPAVASALAFLVVDLLWLASILQAYPSSATVTGTQLAYIDNTWWSQHYGEGYTIGDDRYIETFCVPYHQFALASVRVKCPLRTCETEILVWGEDAGDCGSRDVCREDCQALVDDGQEQYQCASGNGDDDNNNDDGNGQWTEDEVLECAQNQFPTGDTLSSVTIDDGSSLVPWMVTDCTSCRSLSRRDYEWVMDQEGYGVASVWGKHRHKTGRVVGCLLGLGLAGLAVYLYQQTHGGTTPPSFLDYCDNDDDDDDDPEAWKDEHDFHKVEE